MSSILFVRHGQAAFGGEKYDELSAKGRAQAEATGHWLLDREPVFHEILSGPRHRQHQTATLMTDAARLDHPIRVDTALDEFGEGEEILRAAEQAFGVTLLGDEVSVPRDDVLRHYARAYEQWSLGQLEIPGRPSYSAFRARIREWLSDYTGRPGRSGHHSLVVSSAGVISAVICDVMGLDDAHWRPLIAVIGNTSMTDVLYSGSRTGLRSFNSTAHLPVALTSGI